MDYLYELYALKLKVILENASDPFSTFEMQVLDRGEKIELLVDNTENLRSQVLTADTFFYTNLYSVVYFS